MMYCTDDYSESCNIQTDEWICEADGSSICNTGMDHSSVSKGNPSVFQSGSSPANPNDATFHPTRIEVAMISGLIFALIMILCWIRHLFQRKRTGPSDLDVINYLHRTNSSKDDASLSGDSGERSVSPKGSIDSVPNSSDKSSGSKGSNVDVLKKSEISQRAKEINVIPLKPPVRSTNKIST